MVILHATTSTRSKIDHTKRPLLTHMLPPKDGAGRHRASGWGRGSHNPPTPPWRGEKIPVEETLLFDRVEMNECAKKRNKQL